MIDKKGNRDRLHLCEEMLLLLESTKYEEELLDEYIAERYCEFQEEWQEYIEGFYN